MDSWRKVSSNGGDSLALALAYAPLYSIIL